MYINADKIYIDIVVLLLFWYWEIKCMFINMTLTSEVEKRQNGVWTLSVPHLGPSRETIRPLAKNNSAPHKILFGLYQFGPSDKIQIYSKYISCTPLAFLLIFTPFVLLNVRNICVRVHLFCYWASILLIIMYNKFRIKKS